MPEHEISVWVLREPAWVRVDAVGFNVEARDGTIGSVDEATWDVRSGRIVVDTGPWIFGRRVLLPAGVIERIDVIERTVYVACTKEQVKDAPEYDDEHLDEQERYWHSLRTYWGAPAPSGPAVAREDRITS
jgi:hypothetical protein